MARGTSSAIKQINGRFSSVSQIFAEKASFIFGGNHIAQKEKISAVYQPAAAAIANAQSEFMRNPAKYEELYEKLNWQLALTHKFIMKANDYNSGDEAAKRVQDVANVVLEQGSKKAPLKWGAFAKKLLNLN